MTYFNKINKMQNTYRGKEFFYIVAQFNPILKSSPFSELFIFVKCSFKSVNGVKSDDNT